MLQEPELTHPHSRRADSAPLTSSPLKKVSAADKARAKSRRNAAKEAFLSVVRETVEELAVEAASQALEEEVESAERQYHKRERSHGGSGRSHSPRRSSGRSSNGNGNPDYNNIAAAAPSSRPGHRRSNDSASGSPLTASSGRNASARFHVEGGGGGGGGESSDRQQQQQQRRRRQGGEQGNRREAAPVYGGGKPRGIPEEGMDEPRAAAAASHRRRPSSWVSPSGSSPSGSQDAAAAAAAAAERAIDHEVKQFRSTGDAMADDERETLLELLSDAYGQVNDLTDELKMSLDKLSATEKELKVLAKSKSNAQLLSNPPPRNSLSDFRSAKEMDLDPNATPKRTPKPPLFKAMFNGDEGGKSTPVAVRQLQVEVQRLRQRNAQAQAKEENYKADISHMQSRLMAVMESEINKTDQDRANAAASSVSSTRSAKQQTNGEYFMTPGGTRYQDGVTTPLVARVAELEERLVACSMENATAKQEHLTAELNSQKLEKTLQKLRHELAKSRAMNDLLQNEIDRLQGQDPEEEADGSGWRRWLGGAQEPSPDEPNPIEVCGEGGDSPVVVVRDLDNDTLVYAPGRSEFM
ncbi:unnamed protein product [Pylaiella littoralis]